MGPQFSRLEGAPAEGALYRFCRPAPTSLGCWFRFHVDILWHKFYQVKLDFRHSSVHPLEDRFRDPQRCVSALVHRPLAAQNQNTRLILKKLSDRI